MTQGDYRAQSDTLSFEAVEYDLVVSDPPLVFDPKSHGISPYEADPRSYKDSKPLSFVCAYRIKQRALHLVWLGIKSANKRYPLINGRRAVTGWNAVRENPGDHALFLVAAAAARVYTFPDFEVDFTGTIRIARGNAETPIGHSLRDETAYQQVLELVLDHGVVVAARDLSKIIV